MTGDQGPQMRSPIMEAKASMEGALLERAGHT